MPTFVLAYHGGARPKTPAEGQAHQTRWRAWVAGLGDAMPEPELPLGASKTVSASGVADGGGVNPLLGISKVQAADLDAALQMAKDCPHLDLGGTIEVAEVWQMS